MNKKNTIAILMSVRNEESYIDLNIEYHLDLGFDYIFIADHCSEDGTSEKLLKYKDDFRVIVIKEDDPIFDHAKITNKLLKYAKDNYKIDWFTFLDVDEFLSLKDGDIHSFVDGLEGENIPYATIGWANALFDLTMSDYRCAPVNPIDTTKFFYPFPERGWQEYGHFRKAIVRNHENMEVVVGGHYTETGNNIEFFGEYHWNPFIVPSKQAKLLHFEFRGKAEYIYRKWEKLALFENDSTSRKDAPWLERIETIKKYVKDFKNNIEEINTRWFSGHRTFWGTLISEGVVVYDNTLLIWYRKYFRRKLERREIKSVCLVREGNLGDLIMTEPVARFLLNYVDDVYLATRNTEIKKVLPTYKDICSYERINENNCGADINIRLVYELSGNDKTYIQGYMESVGFGDVELKDIPKIRNDWDRIIIEKYFLISPYTSKWEEKKRSWGYEKYLDLKEKIEKELNIKGIILEKEYSFDEMFSLIKNCEFVVGNDSGPLIIAQSFNKKSFIIFGATDPKYLHLCNNVVSFYDKGRHDLCRHNSRFEEIQCCEESCMDIISVKDVFDTIIKNI